MNKRKEWKDYDIVRPEDAQRWEDKPDLEEIKTIVEETAGSGGSSEVVEEVKSDLDEHLKDKGNPHEVTAEQVGAYTKEETDGRIGNLDDLETESKESLVSAVNELKNETAEIADTSVKTISVGKGLDRIVHYPDQNGDINFSDDFYVPNRGKVIAEGDMPTYEGISADVASTAPHYARVDTNPLSFVINDEDINSFAGIAVDYDLLWYSNPDNDWWGTEKIVIPINKLSSIPEKDFSSVYFKVTEATTLNTVLFSKEDILENVNSNEYISQTIYGQFLRRYEQGIAVDEKLKTYFGSGSVNFIENLYDTDSQRSRDYKKDTISGIENYFYYYLVDESKSKSFISKGNTISMVLNLKDNILNIKPVPLVYYKYGSDGYKSTLTIMMVPTKVYYYN